jgi:S1-C subfamily serine protease
LTHFQLSMEQKTMRTVMLAAAAAALLQVGCAHAQNTPAAGGNGGGFVMQRPPAPVYTGIAYSGSPQVQADGTVRSAEHPVISRVVEGSPAARAGLQPGDVILTVNGRDARELGLLRASEVGQEFALRIRRGAELRDVTIVAEANPAAREP